MSYTENLKRVTAIVQKVGKELASNPRFRQMIVEPLQILGVDGFGESAMILKLIITTQPLRQWDVGRELRRRIKVRFDQEGIAFPYPQLTVHMAPGRGDQPGAGGREPDRG